jgi:hypothetical protein
LFKEKIYDDPMTERWVMPFRGRMTRSFRRFRRKRTAIVQIRAIIEESRRWHQAEETDRAVEVLMAGIKNAPDKSGFTIPWPISCATTINIMPLLASWSKFPPGRTNGIFWN